MLTLKKYCPSLALFCNYSLHSNCVNTRICLLPVDVSVPHLHLSQKVHEDLLSLTQLHLGLVTLTESISLVEVVDQLLVRVVDCLSFEAHVRENINN